MPSRWSSRSTCDAAAPAVRQPRRLCRELARCDVVYRPRGHSLNARPPRAARAGPPSLLGPLLALEEAAELLGARRMAELAQRLRLDLQDALAGDVELLADLFQRVVGVHFDAEA